MATLLKGLNWEHVNILVRAIQDGMDWDEAVLEFSRRGFSADEKVLEGWREEVMKKAGRRDRGTRVMPTAPTPAKAG